MSLIETHNLTRKFGDRTAVDNLNISVDQGEVLAFLGPNGAGKTTTVRLLAGIISPTSGYAVVAGLRTDKQAEPLHEVIGLLTETPGFYDRMSGYDNLLFYASLYSIDSPATRVEKYLKAIGLWERRADNAGSYSRGMKQRLALARALLPEPKVLFLDEPTSGLDPEAAREVRGIIQRLSQEGRTIFLCTHNLNEAEELASRIAVFQSRLRALDTAANLRDMLFRRHVVARLETVPDGLAEMLSRLPFIKSVAAASSQIIIELAEPDKNLPDLVKAIVDGGGKVLSVNEEQHSLEEIYLKLLHEEIK